MNRRRVLLAGAGSLASLGMPCIAFSASTAPLSPVLEKLVRQYARGAPMTAEAGRVRFDIAPLVENGNAVPVEITVESPMTAADHVTGIAIFNEKNPQNDVVEFTLTPAMGRARAATRIRLAMSQQLAAVARMNDGRCLVAQVDVLVTLASCLEDE